MARPIKETPILTGADARRFEEEVKANESIKIPAEDYERAMKTYNEIMGTSTTEA